MSEGKMETTKSLDMIKGGGSGDGEGPTSSSRSYPKRGNTNAPPSLTPNFNPMKDKKRGATDWIVGGVGS
jgi:hypothetical protein